MILLVPHAYLVIMIVIIEQLQILINANAIKNFLIMGKIQFVNLVIIHGF